MLRFPIKLFCYFLFSVLLAGAVNCKEEEPFFKPLSLPFQQESAHFSFYYDASFDAAMAEQVKTELEEEYAPLLERLQAPELTKVKVAIWTDAKSFNDAQNNRFPGSTGYVYSKNEIRILHLSDRTPQIVLHEFVHAVTLFISEDFDNNPRWLWEAIAIFEAHDFRDPRTIPYLTYDVFPSLAELNGDFNKGNQKIYEVGYTLAEFIVTEWGYEKLHALIVSHGDLQQALSVTPAEFEFGWREFVRKKYP
jgi:hypothetical protein